jgi:hypothetical protein
MDTMFVGTFAGGDGGPEHGREHQRKGRQVAHHALADDFFQVRHLAGIQQRGDDFPIGGVPTDEQDFMGHDGVSLVIGSVAWLHPGVSMCGHPLPAEWSLPPID